MSKLIEFSQIEKRNIISENKIFGIFEIAFDDINIKDCCQFNKSDFHKLLDIDYWAEVYLQPPINEFLFYLLAYDTQANVGFTTVNENNNERQIVTAFDPNLIYSFLIQVKEHSSFGSGISNFKQFLKLVEEAIAEDLLIFSHIKQK